MRRYGSLGAARSTLGVRVRALLMNGGAPTLLARPLRASRRPAVRRALAVSGRAAALDRSVDGHQSATLSSAARFASLAQSAARTRAARGARSTSPPRRSVSTIPRRVVAMPGTELGLRFLPSSLSRAAAVIAGPTYWSHADAWKRAGARHRRSRSTKLAITRRTSDVRHDRQSQQSGWAHRRARAPAGYCTIAARAAATGSSSMKPSSTSSRHTASAISRAPSAHRTHRAALVRQVLWIGGRAPRLRHREPTSLPDCGRLFGDWPLSADALRAGIAAYADHAWAAQTRDRLQQLRRAPRSASLRAAVSISSAARRCIDSRAQRMHASVSHSCSLPEFWRDRSTSTRAAALWLPAWRDRVARVSTR